MAIATLFIALVLFNHFDVAYVGDGVPWWIWAVAFWHDVK